MSDLISRKAAIDAIEHRLAEPAYYHTGEDWYVGMNCAESELYDLPSVEPEIIRCKHCRYYAIAQLKKDHTVDKRYRPSCCVRGKYAVPRKENWFCADAERKDD